MCSFSDRLLPLTPPLSPHKHTHTHTHHHTPSPPTIPRRLSSHFNSTARGFPDIAAQAVNFVIVTHGIPLPGVSGTSCASPTAAGIFGLLNDRRASSGKKPLGFLNPFIYANAAAFNDITKGKNNGCGSTSGFPAAAGWDAATGLGSPNYPKLAAAVDALP